MSSTPTPTWYDVLGVSPDATPDEIKTAWRAATDRFEPGSGQGQFRMFNEAADVLLDPARRAAYDAELGVADKVSPSASPSVSPTPAPAPAAMPAEALATTTPPVAHPESPAPTKAQKKPKKPKPAPRPADVEPAPRRLRLIAAALALLAVVAVGVAAYYATQVRQDAQIADARTQAPAAAERAAKALLSYDYRRLPTDRERASGFLTADYRKEYLRTFSLLEKNKDGSPGAAVQTKAVVAATVMGSGVVDAEPGVARVLVFVNQVSQKEGQDPQIFQNRVTMTMVQDGSRWLVDDLKSY